MICSFPVYYSACLRAVLGGRSVRRHIDGTRVSVASACNIVSAIDGPVLWFIAPNGAIHAVCPEELRAQEHPFERDFLPASPASFLDLADALDSASRDDVFFLALHGGDGENGVIPPSTSPASTSGAQLHLIRCAPSKSSRTHFRLGAVHDTRSRDFLDAGGWSSAPRARLPGLHSHRRDRAETRSHLYRTRVHYTR